MSRVTLIEIQPRLPDGTVKTLRLVDRSPRAAAYFGAQWLPYITELPGFETAIGFDGQLVGSLPSPQIGALSFALAPDIREAAGWVWRDAPVTIRQADWPIDGSNPADAAFGDAMVFTAIAFSASDGVAQVELLDRGALLRVPIAPLRYGSSGIAVLDAAAAARDRQAGAVVPVAFGRVLTLPGLLIDRANNVWLFAAQPATSIQAFYDGGVPFTLGTARASLAALQAASPVAGTVDWCLNAGGLLLARPADRPVYPFTADATFGSAALGDVLTTLIGGRLPIQTGDAAALSALGLGDCGLYIDDEATVAEAVDRLLGGLGICWKVRRDGKVTAFRLAWSAPVATYAAHRRHAPIRLQTILPTARRQLGYARNNKVHSEGDIARILLATELAYADGTLIEALKPGDAGSTRNVARGTYDNATAYVRGDEVIFSGSSYRLIVPSSTGNPPPDASRWVLTAAAGSGPAGADGLEGISVIVTNEAHVVPTAPNGSGGSYGTAGGTMILRRGAVVLAPTFSIAAQSPNTGWATIDAGTGVYTIADPGASLGTATLRATVGGVNYDRTYTVAKSLQGVDGPNVKLVADGQAFTFAYGAASPASQLITLTALLTNIAGTAAWSSSPAVTLGGSGNTRTLSEANFGSNRQVTIEATLGGITDRITLHRIDRESLSGNAVVNSEFTRSTYGFEFSLNTFAGPLLPVNGGVNLSAAWSGIKNVLWASVATSGANWNAAGEADPFTTSGRWIGGGMTEQRQFGLPVKAGDTVYARCLLARHRCVTRLYLLIYDKDGNLLEAPSWTGGRVGGAGGGDPANFDVVGGTHLVSNSLAVSAQLMWRMLSTSEPDPYIFMTEPGIGLLPPGQTELPPYQKGDADPLADKTSTNIAADTAAVAGVPAATVNGNIATAQTTANSKNRTWTGASTPVGAQPGDYWAIPGEQRLRRLNAAGTIWEVQLEFIANARTSFALSMPGSGTFAQIGVATLGVGPNGNVQISATMGYAPSGSSGAASGALEFAIDWRPVPGTGGWTQIGSTQVGTDATRGPDISPGEPGPVTFGSVTIVRDIAGPGSVANQEYRVRGRLTGDALSALGSEGIVSWMPA